MIEALPLPSGDDVIVGQTIGKYEVLQRLAAGGMAEIFLARVVGVLGFDKLVVIKRILPHLASRHDFIQMFLDEARIATTLDHANIVQTHEVGVHGKSYFMVMEYLAGEDVRSIVRRIAGSATARVPLEHALTIAVGVAAGLHYAHEKRDRDGKPLDIVHRDVTPQNVIVTYDGAVKLLDFGIAKASNRINETRSGSFKGKVPYMSPEQCRGEPLDRRSDLFSLGILLHELTLCRRLFRGETDFQILKQIAEGPIVRPRAVDAAYDARLEAIVMKALERDPARRFQTARQLQQALEELAHDLRLRLSPLALADYLQGLFGEKIGAWQAASAAGDV
ncbi:MAG TPA: serine/threonine-protein kinase, partial [Polyangia bacterium]